MTGAAEPTAGRNNESGGTPVPPLFPLTASLLLITGIRAAVALVGVAALVAVFADDRAIIVAFVVGTAGMTAAALWRAGRGAYFESREQAEAWPPDAGRASWPRIGLRAAYPSTIALAVLIAAAAPIDAILAGLLAGFELGLALMSLTLAAENGLWEFRTQVVVAYAPGLRARYYARPRRS
jgi:hypothetical protein